MLSARNAPYIQSLLKIIESQSKTTLLKWVLDYSEKHLLPLWDQYYPEDLRPQKAIAAAFDWLQGKVNFTQVKPKILECHAAARECVGNAVAHP